MCIHFYINIKNFILVLEGLWWDFHRWNIENSIIHSIKLNVCILMWNNEFRASYTTLLPTCQNVTQTWNSLCRERFISISRDAKKSVLLRAMTHQCQRNWSLPIYCTESLPKEFCSHLASRWEHTPAYPISPGLLDWEGWEDQPKTPF